MRASVKPFATSRLSLGCWVVLSAFSKTAWAEGAAGGDTTPLRASNVRVEIEGRTALPVALYAPHAKPGKDAPVLRCATPCGVRLERGQYRLVVGETQSTNRGDRLVRIDRDLGVSVDPTTRASRNAWGAVAIVGTTASFLGPLLFFESIPVSCDDSSSNCKGSIEGAWIGFISAVVGLPTAIVGWIGYAGTFGLDVSLRPLNASPGGPRGATEQPVRRPAGAALELRLNF